MKLSPGHARHGLALALAAVALTAPAAIAQGTNPRAPEISEAPSPSSTKAQVIASRGGDPALPWAFGGLQVAQTTTPHVQPAADGFDWGSAGIGAAAASGLILVAVSAAYRARIRIAS
jgi:hypothetical protein